MVLRSSSFMLRYMFCFFFRTEAMDEAAKNGHLEVVRWLHENRIEGCTGGAMDMASRHGYLDVSRSGLLHSITVS